MLKKGKIVHEMYWADGTPVDPDKPLPEAMIKVIAEMLAPMVIEDIKRKREAEQKQ